MVHVARGAAYRAREDGRTGRSGWLLLTVALNLVLWSGVIALISRAA